MLHRGLRPNMSKEATGGQAVAGTQQTPAASYDMLHHATPTLFVSLHVLSDLFMSVFRLSIGSYRLKT